MVVIVRLATNLTSTWKLTTLRTALEITKAQDTYITVTTQSWSKTASSGLSVLELLNHHQSEKIWVLHRRGGFLPMKKSSVLHVLALQANSLPRI